MSPSSTPSSGTPPGEDINFQAPSGGSFDKGFLGTLTSQLSTFGGNSGSKRRFGGGPSHGSSGHGHNRDSRNRRRGDSGRMDSTGGSQWEGKGQGGRKDKDELLDQSVVDYLRKGTSLRPLKCEEAADTGTIQSEIGDPFQDPTR